MGCFWSPAVYNIAGRAAEGYVYCQEFVDPNNKDPWAKHYITTMMQRYGDLPNQSAANTYEAIYVLVELIKGTKKEGGDYYTGERLEKQVLKIRRFKSIAGGYFQYRDDHGANKPTAVVKISDGKMNVIEVIIPR